MEKKENMVVIAASEAEAIQKAKEKVSEHKKGKIHLVVPYAEALRR